VVVVEEALLIDNSEDIAGRSRPQLEKNRPEGAFGPNKAEK
jgi:hypothetical protein